jgi:hypothetical protein
LVVATYKVTLIVNGRVKAAILDAKTQLNKATQLNFSLTGKTASAKKHTHMAEKATAPVISAEMDQCIFGNYRIAIISSMLQT